MKYAWIRAHQRQNPVSMSCQVLGVSASGYRSHSWGQPKQSRWINTAMLLTLIRSIHEEFRQEYGWPKMHREIKSHILELNHATKSLQNFPKDTGLSRKGLY